MTKERVLGFTDGVIAIILTIMVLELRPPEGTDPAALASLLPVFLSYLLSFVFVGIYWANHHHTFMAVERVHGGILWANLHLLFWLSLIPFVTAWMGDSHFAPWPVAAYGVTLLLCAVSYTVLVRVLLQHHGEASTFARALGGDGKGKISLALYVAAVPLALVRPGLACGLYATVALIWLVPDRRFERALAGEGRAR